MAKIKIEAIIDLYENYFPLDDQDEKEWFIDMMNDKEHTNLILWSNDLGDEIGSTFQFKWELIYGGQGSPDTSPNTQNK